MDLISCAHLDKVVDAVNNYNIILAYYVACIAEGASKRKAVDSYCCLCKSTKRIHACLECAFFGCFDQENGETSHMEDHYLKNNHCFAININHGCLFCFECNDYIYDETFEDIFNEYKLEAIKIDGYQPCMPWKPKVEEIALLRGKIKKISDDSYIGLRGIVNVGVSCYKNVIIQSFMHNPVLRDFFLSDKHICFSKKPCLACEMFVLFQEFYSGKKEPIALSENFFHAFKKCCPSGSVGLNFGTEEDTFEFLLQILSGLHNSCKKSHASCEESHASCEESHASCEESCASCEETHTSSEESHETDNCNCMIHQTFYGVNQSFKECLECKISSFLPLDHFPDILLNSDGNEDSVLEILKKKFLEPQLLSDHECSRCGKKNTTYLYQTIKKLPTVICFRLNLFTEYKSKAQTKPEAKKTFCKKLTKYKFEEWIDMSPYINSNGDRKLLNGNHECEPFSYPIENRYKLFAVILHKSEKREINTGHYSIYVRQRQNRWFQCNDHNVIESNLDEVLACDPFLLFYYKQL